MARSLSAALLLVACGAQKVPDDDSPAFGGPLIYPNTNFATLSSHPIRLAAVVTGLSDVEVLSEDGRGGFEVHTVTRPDSSCKNAFPVALGAGDLTQGDRIKTCMKSIA